MSESLFLNKRKVDIYSKPITRRIQIGDISEVTERKSSFSYTIKIPKTSNNLGILEMLSTGGNTSLKPFEEVVADYIINNVYLIQNGIAVIRSVNEKDISINLIDGFRGLANLLGDKRINEIDLSDLNHEINSEVMVNSYDNTEGYIYGFADFGKDIDDSSSQETERQAPSVYLHTIMTRIFEEAGYDLIGNFFTTDEKYLNEVITPSNGYEVSPAGTVVIMSEVIGDTKQIDVIRDLANRHGLLMKPNNDITGFEFKKMQEVLNSKTNADDWTNKVSDLKNENYSSGYAQINTATYDYADSSVNDLDGELLTDNYVASPEKEIFKGVFQIPENFGIVGHSFNLPSKEIFKIPIWGDYVQKEANIETEIDGNPLATPSRLKQDGTTEAYTGGRIERYDITSPSGKEYAINGSVIGVGYCMVCYYDVSDVFISYEIAGASEVINYTKKGITVPSSTRIIRVSGTTFPPNLYEYELVNYDSAEIASVKPSIMYIDKLACYTQFEYFGYITTIPIEGQSDDSDYIPFLSTKFMSLQYSLDNNYKSFKDLLNNYKKLDLITNLSLIDVHNLDFYKLKYLKQTGRFYYVNNIQYAYGKLAKCEALEILNFAINYPPILNNFTRKVNSIDIASLKEIIISKVNFFNNYYDKEFDEPLKIKIIDGFNNDIKLYQNGVLIDSEIEIDYSDLSLTAVAQILDGSAYLESWNYNIMDAGSLEYSEEVAVLSVNALASVDFLGAVKPNANISLKLGETTTIVLGVQNEKILTGRTSSYDNYTGDDDNKYYEFVIISKPANSTAYISENIEDYEGTIVFTGSANDLGAYIIRLTVTSRDGLTGYEDYNLTITEV